VQNEFGAVIGPSGATSPKPTYGPEHYKVISGILILQLGKRASKSYFQQQDSAVKYSRNQIEGIQVDILLVSPVE
jgi:hypothetical protein